MNNVVKYNTIILNTIIVIVLSILIIFLGYKLWNKHLGKTLRIKFGLSKKEDFSQVTLEKQVKLYDDYRNYIEGKDLLTKRCASNKRLLPYIVSPSCFSEKYVSCMKEKALQNDEDNTNEVNINSYEVNLNSPNNNSVNSANNVNNNSPNNVNNNSPNNVNNNSVNNVNNNSVNNSNNEDYKILMHSEDKLNGFEDAFNNKYIDEAYYNESKANKIIHSKIYNNGFEASSKQCQDQSYDMCLTNNFNFL